MRLVWVHETDSFGQTRVYARVLASELLNADGSVWRTPSLRWSPFT